MESLGHFSSGHQPTKGFSLVELIVAMVLGVIVIGGAISVYLASKRSLTEVEQVVSLSENGRFALQLIGYSARHIGFYGGASPGDIIRPDGLGTVAGDCTGDAAAYDADNSFFAIRATRAEVRGCITDAMPYTDVLVIKGVATRPLYDANPEDPTAPRDGIISFPAGQWNSQQTYVIANSESGMLLDGADTPPDVGEGSEFALAVAWPYRLQIYYIRDGATPTLSRKILAWDAETESISIQTEDLVQGVENMRFRFGYDSNNDDEVDTLANVTDVAIANKWDKVTSLQVFLLLASDVSDPNYTDEKTYQLGDIAVSPEDSVRRILVHSDMTLRNRRLVLRGGGQ
jgi:type IV pilus assembly protein PilW